ncbi:hypothetical protein, partial [Herbiconiux daphne]
YEQILEIIDLLIHHLVLMILYSVTVLVHFEYLAFGPFVELFLVLNLQLGKLHLILIMILLLQQRLQTLLQS